MRKLQTFLSNEQNMWNSDNNYWIKLNLLCIYLEFFCKCHKNSLITSENLDLKQKLRNCEGTLKKKTSFLNSNNTTKLEIPNQILQK